MFIMILCNHYRFDRDMDWLWIDCGLCVDWLWIVYGLCMDWYGLGMD